MWSCRTGPKKVSRLAAPVLCWYTRAPRVQCLMQAQETNAVCAVAKDTPREGSRSVEAAIDSGAEESAAPPNVFPSEIHASAMFQLVGEFQGCR